MIDLETIEREINELEMRGRATYSLCERLSWLYIVRDHLMPQVSQERVKLGGSEFLDACDGIPYTQLMKVLDEHMDALKVVQNREYTSLMERIRALRS